MPSNLKILDCTLRDGGQGLEDLYKNGVQTPLFTPEDKRSIAKSLQHSGADIIEIGAMGPSAENREGFAIYQNIESLCRFLPKRTNPEQMFVGLYIGPDTDIDQIPEHTPEMVDGVRVILRYSELQKSLDYCAALAQKGYQVFVQPMLTMRYTDEQLHRLTDAANRMGAFALYFVDSYGYMTERDIARLFRFYNQELDPSIHIGFHAHNNMQSAYSNVRYFIEQLPDRKKIVDACAVGMGQGSGNLQTELLVNYLNRHGANYCLGDILDVCDVLHKFRPDDLSAWGYSPERLIAAVHGAAYKYTVAMRTQYSLRLREIHELLLQMPQEMKYRYTPAQLENFLRTVGKRL